MTSNIDKTRHDHSPSNKYSSFADNHLPAEHNSTERISLKAPPNKEDDEEEEEEEEEEEIMPEILSAAQNLYEDELKQLSELISTHIKSEEITSILNFSLVWSLFERELCNNNAKIKDSKTTAKGYAKKDGCLQILKETWCFYCERYAPNGELNETFNNFAFNENDNKEWVGALLRLGERASNCEKLEALLRIAFRLRNNLFHGTKQIKFLKKQNQSFAMMNKLLIKLIQIKMGAQ